MKKWSDWFLLMVQMVISYFSEKEKSQMLDSYRRLDIAVGIARALEYLHTNAVHLQSTR